MKRQGTFVYPARFSRIISEALDRGWNPDPTGGAYQIAASGDCLEPYLAHLWTQRATMLPQEWQQTSEMRWNEDYGIIEKFEEPKKLRMDIDNIQFEPVQNIALLVRCRKCEPCMVKRSQAWALRALHETRNSLRTWFCTFTYRPDDRLRVKIRARGESFEQIAKVCSKDFTLYLKRLRKNTGVKFRYLLAFEPHKDGFPHLHALVHEDYDPITKRQIQLEWKHGFSHVELAEPEHAFYVTKYISKQMASRVRASLRYGVIDTASAIRNEIFRAEQGKLASCLHKPHHTFSEQLTMEDWYYEED